jgi:hypothetical protein
MARPERLGNIPVVPGALIDIADQQRDRRAGGLAFEHAGKNFHLVRLAALCHMARGTWPAAIEVVLDIGRTQTQTGRATVDHAAHRRPMALAERRDCEQLSERVA